MFKNFIVSVVLNVPEKIVQNAIETELAHNYGVVLTSTSLSILWAFIVATQSIGALFGCLALMPFLDAFGVKNSLLVANNAILLVGSFFLFLSYHVQTTILLIFGRILIGVYTGLAIGLIPIYVQELTPKQIKVTSNSMFGCNSTFRVLCLVLFTLPF